MILLRTVTAFGCYGSFSLVILNILKKEFLVNLTKE